MSRRKYLFDMMDILNLPKEYVISVREQKRVKKMNFSYIGAIIVPDAEPEAFRTVCDFAHWVPLDKFIIKCPADTRLEGFSFR